MGSTAYNRHIKWRYEICTMGSQRPNDWVCEIGLGLVM